jgi:hypothetical protein
MYLCEIVPAQYPKKAHIFPLNTLPLPRLRIFIFRYSIKKRVHFSRTNIGVQSSHSLIKHFIKYLLCYNILFIPEDLTQNLFEDLITLYGLQHLMKDIRCDIPAIFLPVLEIWCFFRILISTLTRSRWLQPSFFLSPLCFFLCLSGLLIFLWLFLLDNSDLRSWQVLFIIVYIVPFSLIPRVIINGLVIRWRRVEIRNILRKVVLKR